MKSTPMIVAGVGMALLLTVALSVRAVGAAKPGGRGPNKGNPAAPASPGDGAFPIAARETASASGTAEISVNLAAGAPIELRVRKKDRLVLERTVPARSANAKVVLGVVPVERGDPVEVRAPQGNTDVQGLNIRSMTEAELTADKPEALRAKQILVFKDDFDGAPDAKSGPWGTGGGQVHPSSNQSFYSDQEFSREVGAGDSLNPYSVEKGILSIKAGRAPPALQSQIKSSLAKKAAAVNDTATYYSGSLTTRPTWSQTYGYFEMRAQLPAGEGFWPAFWLNPTKGWPPEIDILEAVYHADGRGVNLMHSALHYKRMKNGKAAGPEVASSIDQPVAGNGANLYDSFHLYAASWDKDWISFYFDGRLTYRVPTQPQFTVPMFLIANLQVGKARVGGDWAANFTNDANLNNTMKIDYIADYLDPSQFTAASAAEAALRGEGPRALKLVGGPGPDTFSPGAGITLIDLGGGADTVNLRPQPDAHKLISHFSPAQGARLVLSGFDFKSPADVLARARQVGPDLWLPLAAKGDQPQTVILRDIRLSQLGPANIQVSR